MTEPEKKCTWGDGITIRPDGQTPLDPCEYETIAIYKNVTVYIDRCRKCGHYEISWRRQPNTQLVDEDEADLYLTTEENEIIVDSNELDDEDINPLSDDDEDDSYGE